MFKSKEIRWFSPTEDKQISQWFDSKNLTFPTTTPRTDFYLALPEKEDMNIKLREGKIEVKLRTGKPQLKKLTDYAQGHLENWVKWSFNVNDDDPLSRAIIEDKKYDWIEVYKERLGIILTNGEEGKIRFLNINNRVPYGCQVEYTRIFVENQVWFTFCLEWFGDEYLKLETSLVSDILGDTGLKIEQSMGYGKFLKLQNLR